MRGNLTIILFAVFFSFKGAFSQTDTLLTFSEIMFSPQSSNNEFIELHNLSETESIDLDGYKIIYSTSNADIISSAGFGTVLQPKSFAVILEGDYDFISGIYNNLIPLDALILKISDNSFGTSGMANTSDRQLWLLKQNGDTLETYTYSANNSSAISDEKIVINKDNSSNNWENSLLTNGTPGRKNSVTPLNNDLSFSSLSINPEVPISGDDVQITDSITISDFINSANEGNYQLMGEISFSEDEDTLNNKKIIQFIAYPPGNIYNDIIVNEIMYAPSSGEPEWIELYNKTDSPINLKKWSLSDNSTTVSITDTRLIQSKSFVILSRDSSILNFYPASVEIIVFNLPALNNTGDAIVIRDSLSVLIDSLSYFPEWGGNSGGRSLERISVNENSNIQSNWGTSVNIKKATPGIINSLTPKDFDLKIFSFSPENDFGIIEEKINFTIQVSNPGLNNPGNFFVKIFRDINTDSVAQQNEQMGEIPGSSILSGDSIRLK